MSVSKFRSFQAEIFLKHFVFGRNPPLMAEPLKSFLRRRRPLRRAAAATFWGDPAAAYSTVQDYRRVLLVLRTVLLHFKEKLKKLS